MTNIKNKDKEIKAYFFDFFGTLAFYTLKKEQRKILSEYHNILLTNKFMESEIPKKIKKEFIEIFNKSKIYLYEDSERVIKRLKKDYKIGIISNTYDIITKKIRKKFSNFIKKFDIVVFSSELGSMKPDHKIFFYALNKFVVDPQETIMVGDKLDRDIIPAEELGMNTILIDRDVNTLEDLL